MSKTTHPNHGGRLRRRAPLAAAALAAAVALMAGQPVSADAGPPMKRSCPTKISTSADFNGPDSRAIFDHLECLIDGTPKGYKIRVAEFRLQDKEITGALRKAADRGVHVQVVVDRSAITGHEGTERDYARKLYKALNSSSDKETFMKTCGTAANGSCKGTNAMHSKIFMFSHTSGSSAVTAIGTANMNVDTLGGTGGWNSFYTDVGNKSLYKRYATYIDDLADGGKDPNYYETLPPQIHGDVKSYFYPRAKGDTTANTLKAVRCMPYRGTVRVATWSFSREAVAKELRHLANSGCTVEIVTNKFQPEVCKELFKGKTPKSMKVRGFSAKEGEEGVHTKDMMIDTGPFNISRAVYTGSLNFNSTSLRLNDETAIRIKDNKKIYAEYVANFSKISNDADIKATGEKSCNTIGK